MNTKDLSTLRQRVQEMATCIKEQENLRLQVHRQLKRKLAKPAALSKYHAVRYGLG